MDLAESYVPQGDVIATEPGSIGAMSLMDQLKKREGDRRKGILHLSTLPLASMLRGGSGKCQCDPVKHFFLDYLEFNSIDHGKLREQGSVEVCFDHANLEDEYLPRALTGGGKRLNFIDLPDGQAVNDLLYRGTYWYRSLWKKGKPSMTVIYILEAATNSEGKIENLLMSKTSPQHLSRVRNAITNCDGVLQTLSLAWAGKSGPWEQWSYVDRVILFLITGFMKDLHFAGRFGYTDFYSKVKKARGAIKSFIAKEVKLSPSDLGEDMFPYIDLLGYLNHPLETRRQVQDLAILSQTRSIGLPPVSYREEAYQKFYKRAIQEEEPLSELSRTLLEDALYDVLSGLTDREDFYTIVARAQVNEKVSLSNSSDLLSPKSEGGKINSSYHLLHQSLPIQEFNLETGEELNSWITLDMLREGKSTIGQALFHLSFKRFEFAKRKGVSSDPLLFVVKPVAVPVPGKVRIATASHPLHAAFLQPLAQVMKPALKHFESAKAGMSKQHHMWEFLKRIRPEMVDVASVQSKPRNRENWFYSEDWEAATDNQSRESSHICMLALGRTLGVPSRYLELAVWALTAPRINRIDPKEGVRDVPSQFVSKRGILQGDPVTKIALQFSHIISLSIAKRMLLEASAISVGFNGVREGEPFRQRPAKWKAPNPLYGTTKYQKTDKGNLSNRTFERSGSVQLTYPILIARAEREGKDPKELIKNYLNEFFGKSQDVSGKKPTHMNMKELLAVRPQKD